MNNPDWNSCHTVRKVAEIIDPLAFQDAQYEDDMGPHEREIMNKSRAIRRIDAFGKAIQIKAMFVDDERLTLRGKIISRFCKSLNYLANH